MTTIANRTGAAARHIVWDWNGTLLNDNHAVLAAVNEVCAHFGRAAVDLDYWRSVFSRPLRPCYERLLGRSLSDAEWAGLNTLYEQHYGELAATCVLADGAAGVLRRWSTRGGSQSLLSMASHESLLPLIDRMKLREHFTRVDGRRMATARDSKAEHLARHLADQELDPADAVLIGDIDDDAHAARSVGAQCVLVSTGIFTHERLAATGYPVADSVPAAVALIGG